MQQTESKKILIIEDEFPMRYLIEYQLRQSGYVVNLAKDGADGLKAIQQNPPDLVLLDIMMPDMDGFEVCTRIKSNPETAHIPVIFVTASEVHEYRGRAFDVGAAEYLTKPFQPDELVAQITAVLHHTEATYEEMSPETVVLSQKATGHITSLFSPKGGVGVTTLAIQFAEALLLQSGRPVMLVDLNLPLGGIAAQLHLFPRHDILELLNIPKEHLNLDIIQQFTLHYRDNMFIIPAPGRLIDPHTQPNMESFERVAELLTGAGYELILDVGSHLTSYAASALVASDLLFVVSSGEPVANQQVDIFIKSADQLQIKPRRIMPVINELYGAAPEATLCRVPVARIPFANAPSDTGVWLKEQGLRKMVSLLL